MAIYSKIINPEDIDKLPLKNLAVFLVIANFVVLFISFLSITILPPQIPIYFGLPANEEQIAKSYFIILPSLSAILTVFINLYLSIKISSIYIKKMLIFGTFAITALSTIATLKIIFLLGSI